MVKITIIYDNEVFQSGLRSDWGFSCLVEIEERKILFDTGADGEMLVHNMDKLKINPSNIDTVFLSHNHWDHTGGLHKLLEKNRDMKIYRPEFSAEPKEFLPNLITTGMLANMEQSLIIKTSKGLVVIGGCSHPGLENILEVARNLGKVYAVLGGFHGFNKFDALEGISLILPCHCTQYKQEILNLYPKTSASCGAGKIIEI
jgi:7,8-dihydropterin-6-yl-methyl-4-(beta-D-ribofuranosyl)aminobenzene 5'-phosphate synthase